MSLDYPLYEEMLHRGSRAAPWWRIGDIIYYIGLLTAIFCLTAGAGHTLQSGSVKIGI
jgi:hypothetical protein